MVAAVPDPERGDALLPSEWPDFEDAIAVEPIPIGVRSFFELVCADGSPFFKDVHRAIHKNEDYDEKPWNVLNKDDTATEMQKDVTYQMPLVGVPIGPSEVTITQDTRCLLTDSFLCYKLTTQVNGAPYSDCYNINVLIKVRSTSDAGTSIMSLSGQVNFLKFTFMKSLIQSNAASGYRSYYRHWMEHLRKLLSELPTLSLPSSEEVSEIGQQTCEATPESSSEALDESPSQVLSRSRPSTPSSPTRPTDSSRISPRKKRKNGLALLLEPRRPEYFIVSSITHPSERTPEPSPKTFAMRSPSTDRLAMSHSLNGLSQLDTLPKLSLGATFDRASLLFKPPTPPPPSTPPTPQVQPGNKQSSGLLGSIIPFTTQLVSTLCSSVTASISDSWAFLRGKSSAEPDRMSAASSSSAPSSGNMSSAPVMDAHGLIRQPMPGASLMSDLATLIPAGMVTIRHSFEPQGVVMTAINSITSLISFGDANKGAPPVNARPVMYAVAVSNIFIMLFTLFIYSDSFSLRKLFSYL